MLKSHRFLIVCALAALAITACNDNDNGEPGGPTEGSDTAGPAGPDTAGPAGPDTTASPEGFDVAKSDKARIQAPLVADAEQVTFADDNRSFAFDLYHQLETMEKLQDGNIFYSPLSISLALAMTYGGAKGNTATQMAAAMHFTLPNVHNSFNWLDQELAKRNELPDEKEEGDGFTLRIANATWGQKDFSFEQPFLDTLAENYGAGMFLLDFEAAPDPSRIVINDWVAAQTEDRIKDLIPAGAITPLTRLVLTNAIYFLAPWEFPFEPKATTIDAFHRLGGDTVDVPMMHQTESFGYASGDGWQAVEMPYNGRALSMVVILPDEGKFAAVQTSLSGDMVKGLIAGLSYADVQLSFPKFELTTDFEVNDALKAMGMTDAFVDGLADFSGMTLEDKLWISKVVHKAFVKVDEEGTEAAAATAVIMEGTTSVPPPPIPVAVDRPFVFVILDKPTGQLLFVGRVLDPSA